MTIDFALSLSPEGIELLHRVQRGWRRIGQADVTSPTLSADLAKMRKAALTIAPDGIWTKLIIPASQIKYTAIDSTMTTMDDIHKALDGTTPYALDELVIDFERFGGRTHIAAVARETLQEAEDFATAHNFNPVAFVAVPEPFTFQKEVFFGPASGMPQGFDARITVARDILPVMIVGTRLKSRLLVFDLPDDLDRNSLENDQYDLFPPTAAKVVVAKRAALIDLTIAEYHPPRPTAAQKPSPQADAIPDAAPVVAIAPMLATLPLLDAIIPEIHPRKPAALKPQLVPKSAAPKGDATAPIAKKWPAQPRTRRMALLAASLVAFASFAGGLIWLQGDRTEVAAGPDTPLLAVERLGATATEDAPLPDLTDVAPLPAVTPPETLTAQAPDDLPAELAQVEPASATARAGQTVSPQEAARIYAATGVWLRAPRFFDLPSETLATDFFRPAPATPPTRIEQPVALISDGLLSDLSFFAPANPPPADAEFAFDADGFVVATPEGTLTPEGALVFAGLPDLTITPRPERASAPSDEAEVIDPAPDGVIVIAGAPDVVPPLRPVDAVPLETPEPTEPDATSRTPGSVGLAGLELQDDGTVNRIPAVRPRLRPEGLAPAVDPDTPDITAIIAGLGTDDATLRFDSSSALAVPTSQRPMVRPGNFAQIVASARAQAAPAPAAAAAAPAAAPVPDPAETEVDIQPRNSAPLPGGVARAATQEDAISLRQVNLIGVYGRPNDRRALVRLGNGRFVRVEVGSELDGGQVTAIGDNVLNYVKRGQTYAIAIPSG